jgi:uncharacterized SAM-binding protein YcdF (DUF218 family)
LDISFSRIAGALMLPPAGPLIVALAGLALCAIRPRAGRLLIAAGVLSLTVLSMPAAGRVLLGFIEPREPVDTRLAGRAQAMAILGGGTSAGAPEYGGDTTNWVTLERLRYGARLFGRIGLPVLVSGGNPRDNRTPEAAQMRGVLTEEFAVPVTWVEDTSNNTLEAARNCRAMLAGKGIDRIVLVTHAAHMRRARLAFEHHGFSVVEAPTGFAGIPRTPSIEDFFPGTEGLWMSRIFFHELLGIGWYHLRILTDRKLQPKEKPMNREQDGK